MKKTGLISELKNTVSSQIHKYTMIIALIAIWIFFQIVTKGIFLTPRNINNIFLQMCFIGIASCGMVFVMVAAQIDLSVGSVIGFTGSIIAVLIRNHNMNIVPALAITLVIGLLIGIWHGFWVAYMGLPAFIVTLASQMIFRGGVMGVTQGSTIQPNNDAFKAIGQGYLPSLFEFKDYNTTPLIVGILCIIAYIVLSIRTRKSRQSYEFEVSSLPSFILKMIFMSVVIYSVFVVWALDRGIPVPMVILFVVVAIMNVISKRTPFGRHVYAIGGNSEATQLSGVNVKLTMLLIFSLMGILSAISGVVYTSRLNSAAIAGGTGTETDIIASAIIGGTSPSGGTGTIIGCIIGALVMASLENGMSLLSLGSFEKYVIKGLVLLFAVAVDVQTRKRRGIV
ncbi:MAG TPA: sugar ABC transporter permease [Clostridiaceae bacterium]|nr:sugar ABC transporter permease [Clostridiaceae bacterium]